jgi:hypothetical protein
MSEAAEQADEADEAFAGTVPRTEVPAHARAGQDGRGHRFAAYPRCWADLGLVGDGPRSGWSMSISASRLVAAAENRLNALGFVVDRVEEEARRIIAFRAGPFSRQELALQLLGSDRLKASMRVCLTGPLVGTVRWQATSMALFGIPDEGVEYEAQEGVESAVQGVLGVVKLSVLPLLDKEPRGNP